MINIKDFLNYKSINSLSVDKKGEALAFSVTLPSLTENCYKSEAYLMNLADNTTKRIAGADNTSYIWDENGGMLLKEKCEDKTLFYRFNPLTGEKSECFSTEYEANKFALLKNGEILFTAEANCENEEYPEELSFLKESDGEFHILEEIPFWSNGRGFTNRKRNSLFIKEGENAVKITGDYSEVLSFATDEKSVVYSAVTFEDRRTTPGIYRYDLVAKTTEEVVKEGLYRILNVDIIEGKCAFVGAKMSESLMTDNSSLYIVEDGECSKISKADTSFTNTVLYDFKYGSNREYKVFGSEFYFISTEGVSSQIKKIDLNGNITTLTKPNGCVEGYDITPDGKIYFNGVRGTALTEIYCIENDEEIKITEINKNTLKAEDVSTPELMYFKNNGYDVQYVVVKPLGFEEDKKYPAILYIHGGAKTLYTDVFFHEMQLLASRGFFVVYGNPRGSDGQGSEFAKLMGHYGEPDYSDMMKAIDTACERYPQIDRENLGVAGGSYGGIMTNWIIGHTDRFKCACVQRGISNMFTAFGAADNGYNFVAEQMDSTPWENTERLWAQSPLKYANNVKTPTLFIHAREDYRCHYIEAMQMFTALKFHDVKSRVCLIDGENHDLSRNGRPIQRIKRLYEIMKWFESYLK